MPELAISAEKVGFLIEKAREFDVKDDVADPDSGSNASDDKMIDVLGLSNGARSGLTGFVAGIARKTVRNNVTINALLPGPFDTDRLRGVAVGQAKAAGTSPEEIMVQLASMRLWLRAYESTA